MPIHSCIPKKVLSQLKVGGDLVFWIFLDPGSSWFSVLHQLQLIKGMLGLTPRHQVPTLVPDVAWQARSDHWLMVVPFLLLVWAKTLRQFDIAISYRIPGIYIYI